MDQAAAQTTDARDPQATDAATGAAAIRRAGSHLPSIVLFLAVVIAGLAADLTLKEVAFRTVAGTPIVLDPAQPDHTVIPYHDPVTVIPGVLSLRLTTNTGAVFGLGKGGRWGFIAVSLVALVIITRIFWRSPANMPALHIALGLILAGALGNLYDRFMYSAVRDMLHMFPGATLPFGWTWPGNEGSRVLYPWIFNLADAALVIGVAGVLVITWTSELRRRGRETAPD